MDTRRRTPVAARAQAALGSAFVSLLLAAAAALAGTAPASAAASPTPPTVTVTITGSLVPGGTAQATVKATGGSRGATFTYTWQVNGSTTRTQGPTSSTSDKLSLTGLGYGDTVAVTVTPFAGSTAGTPDSDSATLVDHAPTAKVALKTSTGFRPAGQATASVTTADSDGDKVTVTYVWTVDGTTVQTVPGTKSTSDTYSWSKLSAGQVVAVSVVPNDGTMDGAAATASGTVVETAPKASVSLSGSPNPKGTAVANVKVADAERDTVTLSYVWKVNGQAVRTVTDTKSTSDKLPLSTYHYGDVVSVEVSPSDPWLTGAPAKDSETLTDQAPSASITSLVDPTQASSSTSAQSSGSPWSSGSPSSSPWGSPSTATSSSTTPPPPPVWRPNGTATVSATTSDPEGDPVTVTYIWKVGNKVKQTTAGTTATSDTFTWASVPGGTTITVAVVPNDGTKDGAPAVTSFTITEGVPQATVQLSGDIRPGGVAFARVTTSDPDNDPVTLTYVWSVNGAVERIDAGKTSLFNVFALPRAIKKGSKVTLRVVPNDGFFNGCVASVAEEAGSPDTSDDSSYNPASDPYSMYDTTLFTGAQAWWDAGYTGQGVDVAVIDTGVAPVPALSGSGKVVYGPDLSLDSQNPNLVNIDSNGHGTFMAGLIAGHDPSLKAPYSSAPASVYRGMAPDARILSVKVGATDGEVDVTQVIAAIDWIVQHRHDNGMNIRVISLSYGTNSTQSYLDDPLAYAAEQAWRAGIVVVAAAGNTGFQQGAGAPGVADPAMDPFVLAVGGYDTMGTYDSSDDSLGDYSASSAGCPVPACKGPDVLAVGSHLQGLRDPGSFIDLNHPEGRLGDSYFRGSGTSQATALTAGIVALILQRYPDMTPDDVKAFLASGADKIQGIPDSAQGAGAIDLVDLLDAPAVTGAGQTFPFSTGTGTIEGARGSDHLTANNVELSGEQDIFGAKVDTTALAAAEAAQTSWNGGVWNGNTWSGNSWSGNSWSGASWTASGWFGNSWSGNTWSGNSWSGNSWSGNSWSGNTWSGNSWSGNSWSGNTWSGNSWSSDSWS